MCLGFKSQHYENLRNSGKSATKFGLLVCPSGYSPPVCSWYTSITSSCSISRALGVSSSLIRRPSKRKRREDTGTPTLSLKQDNVNQIGSRRQTLDLREGGNYVLVYSLSFIVTFSYSLVHLLIYKRSNFTHYNWGWILIHRPLSRPYRYPPI